MINFCDERLRTQITCEGISLDSHSVENLVSTDYRKRQAGYLAESFVKVPVNITVHLPCNIEIAKISLDPYVGAQKTNGIDVFTTTHRVQDCWLSCGCDKSSCSRCKKRGYLSPSSMLSNAPVGRISFDYASRICFFNPEYTNGVDRMCVMDSLPSYDQVSKLNACRKFTLSSVSHVTIRLTSTRERSNPAIKNLEIWGRPSVNSDRISRVINNLLRPIEPQPIEFHQPVQISSDLENSTVIDSVDTTGNVAVPDDFLDSITCAVMTLPLVLPSGKYIDQSTLDKHIHTEAAWGRKPSDPFTGVVFSNIDKPSPDPALKARIDKFLLLYGDQFNNVPRTVGRVKSNTNQVHVPAVRIPHVNHVSVQIPKQRPCSPSTTLNRSPRKRKNSSDGDDSNSCDKKVKIEGNNTSSDSVNLLCMKPNIRQKDDSKPSTSHENSLKSSLNAAIDSTLDNLMSFTQFRRTDATFSADTADVCHLCSRAFSQNDRYKLPCNHLMCRTCLQENSSRIECHICSVTFSSSEVSLIHDQ